ncbi:MAG: HAMP domain-containing sensor histidine kinase [Acutalibacteraceae bacterium]|nr:HAMP domain-containing sensor histidine kinase [Acutalibacteraceae bacterium]
MERIHLVKLNMDKFHLDLKFKSITTRWFINVFLIVAVFVTLTAFAFSLLFHSIYYERVEVLASDYSYEFSVLEGANKGNFKDSAITLAGEFNYKTKIEVQVLDWGGEAVVSTSGYESELKDLTDFNKCKESGKQIVFRSKTSEGESVLIGTVPLFDEEGTFLGAYRWITSLKAVNRTTLGFTALCFVLALGVIGLFAFSGLYFIKSIVNPIKDVGNIARKIAMGDLESRIEISKNDEIGELCESINYMASELQSAQNLKNDFISSVSHELRTPLTAIRGWGETAKMSVGTDDELVNRGLDVVLSEANRLSGLVEELLDFSRMETGRLQVNAMPLNVTQILTESADMYTELSKQQGIEFIFNPPKEQLEVMGDADRLKQVFINIIDNAVKYTESGGQVLITQTVEEGCVRIIVTDTGVGIPAQDIDRVKEKFYKANKTVRGSGIGLAVADEIIKQHSGLLFLESTEGAGTTVTVVLPLYDPEEETVSTEPEITLEEAVAEKSQEIIEKTQEISEENDEQM